MPRISKEKKEETRLNILNTSKKLFLENGYYNTSINQIAKTVGIAEGTIFNYFDTKADIFLETVAADNFDFTSVDYTHLDYSLSVVELFTQFINNKLSKAFAIPKKVIIELGTAMLGKATAKNDIVSDLIMVDKTYIEQLVGFIKHLQDKNMIKPCDAKLLAQCIFDSILIELFVYLNVHDREHGDVIEKISEKINVILTGYIVGT